MTVQDLIEKLKSLDPEASVQFYHQCECGRDIQTDFTPEQFETPIGPPIVVLTEV
jgi:hypothetical protein